MALEEQQQRLDGITAQLSALESLLREYPSDLETVQNVRATIAQNIEAVLEGAAQTLDGLKEDLKTVLAQIALKQAMEERNDSSSDIHTVASMVKEIRKEWLSAFTNAGYEKTKTYRLLTKLAPRPNIPVRVEEIARSLKISEKALRGVVGNLRKSLEDHKTCFSVAWNTTRIGRNTSSATITLIRKATKS